MAQSIPEKPPGKASVGEKRLHSILSRLPDDCYVYYEPRVNARHPDFVVILPDFGILVIEVKGWYGASIAGGDDTTIQVRKDGVQVAQKHPLRQAADYMYGLKDHLSANRHIARRLFHPKSHKQCFALDSICILSNISSQAYATQRLTNFSQLFPPDRCLTSDVLDDWEELDGKELLSEFRRFFPADWNLRRLDPDQINRLRTLIHPEILIDVRADANTQREFVRVLDTKQEAAARRIRGGHRIIYGIAGSGKTVLLVARARWMSDRHPDGRVLVLCFNVMLALSLRTVLRDCRNVVVFHFHAWAKTLGVSVSQNSEVRDNQSIATAIQEALQKKPNQRFDAILIDEAQDFEPAWFSCCVQALTEPETGDLLIVHDGSQSLYGAHRVRWKSFGVHAQGTTTRYRLSRNYRNTREILQLASRFAHPPTDGDEERPQIVDAQSELAECRSLYLPCLVRCGSRRQEAQVVRRLITQLTTGTFAAAPKLTCSPHEIAVLYRHRGDGAANFITQLAADDHTTWLSGDTQSRRSVDDDHTKLMTIHAAKGLQFRVVILACFDQLPATFANTSAAIERSLAYVAMTRAEDLLIMTHIGRSAFTNEVAESGLIALKKPDDV